MTNKEKAGLAWMVKAHTTGLSMRCTTPDFHPNVLGAEVRLMSLSCSCGNKLKIVSETQKAAFDAYFPYGTVFRCPCGGMVGIVKADDGAAYVGAVDPKTHRPLPEELP